MTEREKASIFDHKRPWQVALLGLFTPAIEYAVDAAQRSVLFWDVMRQRGNQYREHMAETAPMCSITSRADRRRPQARSAGELLARADCPACRNRDRSTQTAVCHRRSARRTRPRYRRVQGRQRDRRRAQGRSSMLFHRLPAGANAGPDHRGYRACRGGLP